MHSGYNMAAYMGVRATRELEMASNNLANSSTVGFKRERLFLWCLENQWSQKTGEVRPAAYVDIFARDFSQGSLHNTENDTDLAIQGSGFFKVETPQGNRYTRNGAFTLTPDWELVTREGYKVMGKNGPITLESRDEQFGVDQEGGIHLDKSLSDQIAVVDFDNPQGLVAAGRYYFVATPEAGEEQEAQGYRVLQGNIEESNIDLPQEAVNLTFIHRAFEAYMKVLDTFAASDRKVIEDMQG